MSEFKVGDRVIVTDDGCTYDTYSVWAEKYDLFNFKVCSVPTEGSVGKIIVAEPHLNGRRNLYAIDIDGQHYIMDADGILQLGNVPKFVAASSEQEKLINASLGLEEVSLNLRKEVIEKFKAKAYDDKVSHIYLMREVLTEYVGGDIDE